MSPGGSQGQGPDLYDWSHWWGLERDAYLELRHRVQSVEAVEAGFSRVRGGRGAPSDVTIETQVIPRLLKLVEEERDDDVVTGALIALGRLDAPRVKDAGPAELGQPSEPSGWPAALVERIHAAMKAHLRAPSQAVAETAALALGLRGEAVDIDVLVALLADEAEGRALVGQAVPTRTRAFAAFGLGLAGERLAVETRSGALARQRIALALFESIEGSGAASGRGSTHHATLDVPVAALIGLGLCPMPLAPVFPDERVRAHPAAVHVLSLGAQLAYFDTWLTPPRGRANERPERARAHALVAAARLAVTAPAARRAQVIARLREISEDRAEPQEARAAAAIALGELVHSGDGDRDARAALARQAQRGKTLERRFALIAFARAAGRPGPLASGDGAGAAEDALAATLAGADAAQRQLLAELLRGRSGDRTWIALALGVLDEALVSAGLPTPPASTRALADLTAQERNASEVGAFATALALAARGSRHAGGTGEVFASVLARIDDPVARGQVLIAAGIAGYGVDEPALRASLHDVRYQPGLLWSTAVTLGLVGDREAQAALIDLLEKARSSASRGALASALGHVGDQRAVAPLMALLDDASQPSATRAFAAVALGVVCDHDPLPWRQPIARALPYFAMTATLTGGGDGVLDVL
ncbi:MAG: HEAT repeat domain-containing protein [Planctomycetota bacterium]